MLNFQVKRVQEAYPLIFMACHRRHVHQDEADCSVTDHQLSILNHLDQAKGRTLSTLAAHLGVSRSTMSITVTRLVRKGYVFQVRDQKDARFVNVVLTAKGVRIREQNSVLDPKLIETMLRLMPAAQLETSLQAFEQLAECAQRVVKLRGKGGVG